MKITTLAGAIILSIRRWVTICRGLVATMILLKAPVINKFDIRPKIIEILKNGSITGMRDLRFSAREPLLNYRGIL